MTDASRSAPHSFIADSADAPALAAPAPDALERLILHDAFGDAADSADGDAAPASSGDASAGDVLVLGDDTGALTLGTLQHAAAARVIVRCGAVDAAQRVRAAADQAGPEVAGRVVVVGLDTDLPGGAELVPASVGPRITTALGRLPKSLAELDLLARGTAAIAADGARLVLGGNQKHMARSMNDVLAGAFENVRGGFGKGKHRCLIATGPIAGAAAHEAQRQEVLGVGMLTGIGGVFSGAKPDRGGSALADQAIRWLTARSERAAGAENGGGADGAAPARVLDLGCGNGLVSLRLLHAAATKHGPGAAQRGDEVSDGGAAALDVIATDHQIDAVRSAEFTLARYRDRARVTWDDAASQVEDASMDLVLLNPPFHEGARIDMTLVQGLLDAAARVLVGGGELLFVHNSHLRYRPALEARFASVNELHRGRMFTVLRAVK